MGSTERRVVCDGIRLRIVRGVVFMHHCPRRTIPTMRTDELDFELPESLIATTPAVPRDSSRLLVVSRSDPDRLEDRVFTDLPGLLARDDLLVFNR